MNPFWSIVIFGVLMSAIALIGSVTYFLKETTLKKLILPLVSISSGSLIGGALFHMLPASVSQMGNHIWVYFWVGLGFLTFLLLEQILHWHHCHKVTSEHKMPISYLILIADGLHNLIGGLSIGALFMTDFRLGLAGWIAAAVHEVPQEIGDFGILLHSGWTRKKALLFNFLSGLTFLAGALATYFISFEKDILFLVPFAAGNFLYIGAVDLIPEFKKQCNGIKENLMFTFYWSLGMGILFLTHFIGHHHE